LSLCKSSISFFSVLFNLSLSRPSRAYQLDGAGTFKEDVWERPNGGGGISRVMADGHVFEKAGCSLSVVYGTMPPEALAASTERGADRAKGMAPGERVPFFACGLSSVMHPKNPFAPTMHFNYR
jgi:coproporphyrinogen III oxidase